MSEKKAVAMENFVCNDYEMGAVEEKANGGDVWGLFE